MDKQHIIDEIRRTAEENGGSPLGRDRFKTETGITQNDWYAKHWRTWGDALIEAGYQPNQLQAKYEPEYLIETLIAFIREIGRYPVTADFRMRARADSEFPSHTVFTRLGRKSVLAKMVIDFCREQVGHDDIIEICTPFAMDTPSQESTGEHTEPQMGFVYLMKSGQYFKIGRTNSVGRREYELAIQLPEKITTVHEIKTDDPIGIEQYWHKRFADKRANGEWFNLSPDDVAAFKRRKFM